MYKLALPRYPLPKLPKPQTPPPPPVPQEFVLGSNSTPLSGAIGHDRSAFIAGRNDSAQLTPEITSGEANEEKRIKNTPQYIYKCRYNCSGTLASKNTLRKHMEGTHQLFPEGVTPLRCTFCSRLYRTQGELKQHLAQGNYMCNVRPAAEAKWNVSPPVTQQEKADTWVLAGDGTPSVTVRIPNPAYTPPSTKEAVQTPTRRSRKRKAVMPDAPEPSLPKPADHGGGVSPERPSPAHQHGELLERPSSAASIIEISGRPIKRTKAISPPAVEPRTDEFSLKGMGLHDVRFDADGTLWMSDRRPIPEMFFQRTGPENDPWQPGQNSTLSGTDAERAREQNQTLLDRGFAARHGRKPTARFWNAGNAPMGAGLPEKVFQSLLATRQQYDEHDAMVMGGTREQVAQKHTAQQGAVHGRFAAQQQTAAGHRHATQQYSAGQRPLPTLRDAASKPTVNTQLPTATMQRAYSRPSIYNSSIEPRRHDPVQQAQHVQQIFNPFHAAHQTQHMPQTSHRSHSAQQGYHVQQIAPAFQASAPDWAVYGTEITETPAAYGGGYGTMNPGPVVYTQPKQGQHSAQSSFDSGYGSMSSFSSAAGSFRSYPTGVATPYYGG